MDAAKYKQHTPLSNTEYFNEAVAEYIKYEGGGINSLSVQESPKDISQYTISAEYITLKGDPASVLTQKRIEITSEFRLTSDVPIKTNEHKVNYPEKVTGNLGDNQDVVVEIKYWYVPFSQGDVQGTVYEGPKETGLFIYFSGSIGTNKLRECKDFVAYGIIRINVKRENRK